MSQPYGLAEQKIAAQHHLDKMIDNCRSWLPWRLNLLTIMSTAVKLPPSNKSNHHANKMVSKPGHVQLEYDLDPVEVVA